MEFSQMKTIAETAKILGLSKSSVFNYIRQGKIKSYKLSGGATRIKLSDIEDFINGGAR